MSVSDLERITGFTYFPNVPQAPKTHTKHQIGDCNMEIRKIMGISTIAAILILMGSVLLVLGTVPMKNKIEGKNLVVKYIIGKDVIDLSDAVFLPVPDDVNHNIIRVGGTSIGRKHSGNFKNIKTKTKYKFYLTGKGERTYFEIGTTKYLVDGI